MNKIIYLCNMISESERGMFYYADSALKKILGFKKILEDNEVEVVILSLSVPQKAFFQQRYQYLMNNSGNIVYYILRLVFALTRFIKYMIYLTRERKKYSTIMSYSYTTQNVLLACFGYYFLGKRIVLDYEDGLFRHRTRYLYYLVLEKIMLKIANGYLIVNQGLKKRLPVSKPFVVVNGVFLHQIPRVNENNTSFVSDKRITILYSGELSFDYGLSYMFKLFLSPNAEKIDFHLTGTGIDEKDLVNFISKNNFKNVYFHGYISLQDLRKLEQSVDCFILCQNEDSPIYHTNFPSKLFHYLSFQKPVFVNRCSLFAEYEAFENVFPIDYIENGGNEILRALKNRKKYYPEVVSTIEDYNNDSVRKLKRVLFD